MSKKIKIIDLFAGIGGIRLGFETASNNNIECVFTSEWDKYSKQTYQANYNNEKVHGDITQINENDIPKHDILLAGFPCQPFSQAGLKKGFSDTRGTLFFDIERILIHRQPQALLLENVKQLKGHDKGRTLNTILEHLKKVGYNNLQYKILRARDFGLPQNRERIYIVGFLDEAINFKFPEPTLKKTRVGNILESKVDEKYTISDRLWAGHQRRKRENKLKGKGFGYGIVNENSEYTNTLSARYYKDGSEILIEQKGKNPRKLTPRECARLQGFPDTFKIPVSNTQAYRQFGNSVPVYVIEKVAEQMLKHIK
ncbi:DNA cytosine methyltransferase [Tenacibaculum maritimum]|uniref:DNA cytosine methyltransferase n=1 Tax=Tenacibaculum maritimum TaxID=107401 RepID=UPI0012E49ED8|nr:DNA cytosine methyltransferase [Tenacibaculum maritimum]CAA0156799.1 Cytosine-specific methyltransferase NlaX [Tenacibaculum maritimum]CAA0196484.1 Cytosine-specific methyltransferase NlaX [Tenacibaculum maritimum]CAA0225759.1 Cytosine-specific methyltransferase [Tenacibaculum maritimum]